VAAGSRAIASLIHSEHTKSRIHIFFFSYWGNAALSAAGPRSAPFGISNPEATWSHRWFLRVGMRAPAVPPSTAPAPRPRPRTAPPAAPPTAPIALFLARRLPRLRLFEDCVVLAAVPALATGTSPSARSPADIRAA